MNDHLKIFEDVVVFVDETGQEELEDPNFPVFGLAGCIAFSTKYDSIVKQPWESIYSDHFENRQAPLRAHEARNYSSKQKEAIAEFFRSQPFLRVATVTNNKSKWPSELFRFQMIAGLFQEQLRQILQAYEFNSVAMIFDSSQRTNHLAEKYFSKVRFVNKQQQEIPVKGYIIQKSKDSRGVPGLEVADFIANAVGGRARARGMGNNDKRPDFQCIFTGSNWNQSSFFELGDVDFSERTTPLPSNLKDWDLSWKINFSSQAA